MSIFTYSLSLSKVTSLKEPTLKPVDLLASQGTAQAVLTMQSLFSRAKMDPEVSLTSECA